MNRVAAIAVLIAAMLLGGGIAQARPLRVMSLNECSDQIVLQLLPPERITSVSWLARDPVESVMAGAAARVPVNHATAEEVLRDRPDLVIAGTYTTPATRLLLKRLHYPMLEVGSADSFADIRSVTRIIAAAVGEQAKGEALIARMDATLTILASDRAPPLRVAAWDGAGFSAQKGSLYDAILTAAGARNVVGEMGPVASSAPSVESLLASAPALIVRGEPGSEPAGRRSDLAFHPLIQRFWKGRIVIVPQSAYLCGTTLSADAAVRLRDQMRALSAVATAPLPFQAAR